MDNPINKDLTNYIIAKNYKLIKKVGAGAFGEIYLAENRQSRQEFAIKLERSDTKFPQLNYETKLYNYLSNSEQNDTCFPKAYASGTDGHYNYMVMDYLGLSLEDLFVKQNKKLSLKTVLMLADQMITCIETLHTKQFLHRDIKPDNFLMGRGKIAHKVYLVDLGLAKRYMTKQGHIPMREGKSLTGTARYASINTHAGFEQSRRDDLESLCYVLLYLLKGQLPWQNMKATNQKEKYQKIMEKKMSTPAELICKGLPNEMALFLNYCKQLKFEEKPDYAYIKTLMKNALKKGMYDMDYRFDWTTESEFKFNKTIETKYSIDGSSKNQLKDSLFRNPPRMLMLPKGKQNNGYNDVYSFNRQTILQQGRKSNPVSLERNMKNRSIHIQNSSRNDLNKLPKAHITSKMIIQKQYGGY